MDKDRSKDLYSDAGREAITAELDAAGTGTAVTVRRLIEVAGRLTRPGWTVINAKDQALLTHLIMAAAGLEGDDAETAVSAAITAARNEAAAGDAITAADVTITAADAGPGRTRIPFGGGVWSRARGEDGFWAGASGFWTPDSWLPATALIGRTVNLGTKDGAVYEKALVTGMNAHGKLVIEGGQKGWPYHPDRKPVPVGREAIKVTEIARGFIWADKPEGGNPA